MLTHVFTRTLLAATLAVGASTAWSHGDVTPQPVDTGALPDLGKELRAENPFREGNEHGSLNEEAIKVGRSGYAGNCAVCHGIEAMSGGLTPDLRELEEWDDEYFIGRVTNGTGRGMPSFKDNLDQTAIWAIRTYVESLPKPE
ncbi:MULTISPECIES: cytochrome c-550 PedF [Marinobacter]|uniref:Cytochrome c-550 PedF n=1 Tax=Marinobacter alkaliphilus TaxID=254719 RepID=A0ABZ3E374_9GAMM|nr:cytochrome c-550 PedF [Marinobacter shengliensis]|eukprot:TRINITY_DN35080_c0_g1_i1.p1 TRINITY_DN35080_c0_g1~~TRINITY_DN35080_c0_g1_i1.p1  ORF type:complete len:143 (-),score=13.93 TRINITY_DN35080_c0_g1_i1:299-727(-)